MNADAANPAASLLRHRPSTARLRPQPPQHLKRDVIYGNIFATLIPILLPLTSQFLTGGLAKNLHQESQCPIFDQSEDISLPMPNSQIPAMDTESQEG